MSSARPVGGVERANVADSLARAFGIATGEGIVPVPPPVVSPPCRFRSLALPDASEDGVGELRAARGERELRDVASPSALIRRATREWPDKCAAVAALAAQLGIARGETWLRVVEAGILSLSDDLREEGVA